MKKIKILVVLLLVVMIGCVALSSCGKIKKESEKSESNDNKNVILADFEEWAPDFQLLKLREEFGAIDVNKDTQYVKSGKQSAKLYVMGWEAGTDPYFFIPTYSELFQFDYTNFNSVDSVMHEIPQGFYHVVPQVFAIDLPSTFCCFQFVG